MGSRKVKHFESLHDNHCACAHCLAKVRARRLEAGVLGGRTVYWMASAQLAKSRAALVLVVGKLQDGSRQLHDMFGELHDMFWRDGYWDWLEDSWARFHSHRSMQLKWPKLQHNWRRSCGQSCGSWEINILYVFFLYIAFLPRRIYWMIHVLESWNLGVEKLEAVCRCSQRPWSRWNVPRPTTDDIWRILFTREVAKPQYKTIQ